MKRPLVKLFLFGQRRVVAARRALRALLVATVSVVEVPIFLVRHRAIFRNRIIYPFWHWSLGHTVSGIDFASRFYFPQRISLIYAPHPGSNPYVPRSFAHNVDVFVFESVIGSHGSQLDRHRDRVLRSWLHLIAAFRRGLSIINLLGVYRTLSIAERPLLEPNTQGNALVESVDLTGYVRLLRESKEPAARLPDQLLVLCREAIEGVFPGFLEKPFVTLLLRTKDQGGDLHTDFRNSGPAENYRPAVEWLCANGYHVAATGETDATAFAGIPGFYDLKDAALDPKLLNVFLLSNAALYIGQQSGGLVLPNAAGVPCLLLDALPHRLGTFTENDLILFKPLVDKGTGREWSLVEIFLEVPEVAYGMGFDRQGVEIGVCTPASLLAAVQEAVARLEGRWTSEPQDDELIARFREIVPSDMQLHYARTQPPLHVLRRDRELLLDPRPVGGHS